MDLSDGMRGAYPPPPAPPASGKVPVPRTGRSTGGAAAARQGKTTSRFCSGLPLAEQWRRRTSLQRVYERLRSSGTGRDAAQVAAFSPPNPPFYAERKRERGKYGATAEIKMNYFSRQPPVLVFRHIATPLTASTIGVCWPARERISIDLISTSVFGFSHSNIRR